jgi:ankyrin repeat protein
MILVKKTNSFIDKAHKLFDKSVGGNASSTKSIEDPVILGKNLNEAVKKDDLNAVKQWLKKGADINNTYYGNSPLKLAVINGKVKMVAFLLDNKAHLNTSEVEYRSQFNNELMLAAWYGHIEVLKLLLERGAKPNVMNSNGDSALSQAAVNGDIEMVELLLTQVTGNELKNDWFVANVLMHAVWRNEMPNAPKRLKDFQWNSKYEVLKLLLDHDFNVNARGSMGNTALLILSSDTDFKERSDSLDIAKLLLKYKADVTVKNSDGETAIKLANKKGNHELLKILRAAQRKNFYDKLPRLVKRIFGLDQGITKP